MPTQANPYLVLTDGTTTVTFQDGSGGTPNWPLLNDGWTPAIAPLRRSPFGGQGPYEDVVEELTIEIRGATASAAYANLATLARLLDQAEQWAAGAPVAAVVFKNAPTGATVSSTAAPMQAVCLGRAPGDESASIALPATYDEVGYNFVITPVRVRFWRRGLWLHGSQSAASSSTDNGNIATVTLPAAVNTASPTQIEIDNVIVKIANYTRYVLLVVAESTNYLRVLTAESMASGPFTSVADTANFARESNVLRYTPTDTSIKTAAAISLGGAVRRAAVFMSIRNNSSTASYKIRAELGVGGTPEFTGPWTLVPAAASKPLWYFCGMIASDQPFQNARISAQASSVSASLDIDSIAVVDIQEGNAAVLAFAENGNTSVILSDVLLRHGQLDRLAADIFVSGYSFSWKSVLAFFTKSAALSILLLGVGSSPTPDSWRQVNFTYTAVLANVFTATRLPAYLIPE